MRIETTAIMIGTIARNDPNTKASTSRAPKPPSSASTSTPGPVAAAALHGQRIKAGQMNAVRRPPSCAGECGARSFRGLRVVFKGLGAVGRRVGDDEGRVPVAREEGGAPGARVARQTRAGQGVLQARFDRPQILLCGGASRPMLRRAASPRPAAGRRCHRCRGSLRWICSLVTQPSLPGTENFCLSALVADPAEAMPTRVRTTQKMTTMRLCARTQRVSGAILIVLSLATVSGSKAQMVPCRTMYIKSRSAPL